MASQGGSLLGN